MKCLAARFFHHTRDARANPVIFFLPYIGASEPFDTLRASFDVEHDRVLASMQMIIYDAHLEDVLICGRLNA